MIEKKIQKNNYFEFRKIDSTSYKNQKLPIWIRNQLENKEIKILDYGCGFGQNMTGLLNDGFKNVFGVDIEHSAIKQCTKNNLNVKELDLENIDNPFYFKFDVIILSHIIEHIPKSEIINTLSFIRKYFLLENGMLLISVPNAQSNTNAYWAYEDWTHTTLFTTGSLYYVLKSAGFNTIEFIDVDCTLGNSVIKKLLRQTFLVFYKLNYNFWNEVTCSSFHKQSPHVFSYEIKVKVS